MKRQYNLYLDIDSMEILKVRNVNISQFISNLVEAEAGLIPDDKVSESEKMKLANGKLIEELNRIKQELEKTKKEMKEKKEEKVYQQPEDIEWPEVL